MTERMTMANTETTMLHCVAVSLSSFVGVAWRGFAHQDHACITPTTGFILAIWGRYSRSYSDAALAFALSDGVMNEGMSLELRLFLDVAYRRAEQSDDVQLYALNLNGGTAQPPEPSNFDCHQHSFFFLLSLD